MFKNKPKMEVYLKEITNPKFMKVLTKFRLSDHNLMIEEGRRNRPRIDRINRLCLHCNKSSIEDEMHFLIKCSKYNNERCDFFQEVTR